MQATAGLEKNLHTGRGGRCWWIIVAVVALMLPLKGAGAENALSIYGGMTVTDNDAVTVTDMLSSPPLRISEDVDFDVGVAVGLRYTRWWKYFGLALDVSYFTVDPNRTELVSYDVIPLSLYLMLRLPLGQGPRFPQGRLHPYIGLGPTWAIYDFQVADVSLPYGGGDGSGSDTTVTGLLGLNWQLTRRHGFFLEFKHTHFKVDADDKHRFWGIPAKLQLSGKLTTHHFLVGYAFKF